MPAPVTLLTGDCLEVLRDWPDGYFSAIVTDPPYGLSRAPDMVALLTAWLAGESYAHGSRGGFMSAKWDAFVPGPNLWREIARVLKPGGHLLCFASTRTWDLMSLAIRLAGFENRDTVASLGGPPGLVACHGQGFSKSRRHLKPAWEVILCFRKPLSARNVAANIAEHGTGGLNVDACRVATVACDDYGRSTTMADGRLSLARHVLGGLGDEPYAPSPLGRYPPNLLLQHHPECAHKGTRTDSSGLETVEDWECHEDCAVRLLGEQSGESQSVVRLPTGKAYDQGTGGLLRRFKDVTPRGYADPGTAARFFPQFSPDESDLTRFRYQSKPSKSERGHGCSSLFWRRDKSSPIGYAPIDEEEYARLGEEERRVKADTGKSVSLRTRGNIHPTLKSRALLRWLVRLVTPPGGVILDPFAGTGTTGLAVMDEGFQAVLIEREPLYARIAQARLDAWAPQKDKVLKGRQKEPRHPRPHNHPEPARQAGQIELFEEARVT